MDKSTLLLLAIVLAVFGVSVAAGHPAWGTFTGIAIILLAAGLAAGTLPLHSQDYFEERIGPSPRISNSLITLSSAAIVAIYAAGYHRTSSAAHRFDLQTSDQRTSATLASVPPPAAANPAPGAGPAASGTVAPPVKKNNARPPNSTRKTAPAKPSDSGTAPSAAPTSAAAGNPPSEAVAGNPPAEAAAPPPPAGQSRYKDGVYLGLGSCRHGDIEASVTIQGGKIISTVISQCLTRYSCSWIAPRTPVAGLPDLPAQVVERQSAKVDYVSGATESSYAFSDAVAAALSKALE
jgi:uncharacterized protein with FMN-binding domain